MVKKTSKKRYRAAPKIKKASQWHVVPLKGSFMVTAILGFILSYYYVYPISLSFGIVCLFFFTLMFIASIISMTKAPLMTPAAK